MTPWVSYNKTETPKPVQTQPPTTNERPILKKGSKGAYVIELQKLLKAKGYDPKGIDGDFGNNTQAAVKKFQEAKFVTGVVDNNTWNELYK